MAGSTKLFLDQTGLQKTNTYSVVATVFIYKEDLIYAVSPRLVIPCPTDVCQESSLAVTNVDVNSTMVCESTTCTFEARPISASASDLSGFMSGLSGFIV